MLFYLFFSIKLPSLRVFDFSNNPLDSSATSKASKAFPDLIILNGEALTLSRLLEEISSDDFGKSSDAENNDSVEAGIEIEDGHGFDGTNNDDVGVNEFIHESTRNLEGPSVL